MAPESRDSFLQAALIASFRIPVAIALKTNNLSSARLLTLLRVATFRELRAQGYSTREMAILLNCTRGTIKNYSRQSKEIERSDDWLIPLRRLWAELMRSSLTLHEIRNYFPTTEFDTTTVAVKVLLRTGILEGPDRNNRYNLSATSRSAGASYFASPISEVEFTIIAAVDILRLLGKGAMTQPRLYSWARLNGLDSSRTEAALAFLIGEGDVQVHSRAVAGGRQLLTFSLLKPLSAVYPVTPGSRRKVGLLQSLESLRLFCMRTLEEASPMDQRLFVFLGRPAGVRDLIQRHVDWVRQAVEAEDDAAEREADADRFFFYWAVAPETGADG